MNSILFWNELSLVMKNGLFTITLFENDHGPSVMNHHKQHRKLNCIKKRLCCLLGAIGKVLYLFELLPRNQTINSDVYCRQPNKLNAAFKEKRPELVNRDRCNFSRWQRYTIHFFSHSPKIIKYWLECDVTSTI